MITQIRGLLSLSLLLGGQLHAAAPAADWSTAAATAQVFEVRGPLLSSVHGQLPGAVAIEPAKVGKAGVRIRLRYGAGAEIDQIEIDNGSRRLGWQGPESVLSTPAGTQAFSPDSRSMCILANPIAMGWQYQSYSFWIHNLTETSYRLSVASFGWPSADGDLPVSGNANYEGFAIGFYTDAQGVEHNTVARIYARVNFSEHSATVSLLDTSENTSHYAELKPIPFLDASGELNFRHTARGIAELETLESLRGQVEFQFYGPQAQEFGGVFSLSTEDGRQYIATFGARDNG